MTAFDVNENIEHFLYDLKKGNLKNTLEIACETVRLLERMITNCEWTSAKDLMNLIRTNGKKLMDRPTIHIVVSSMVKRVLKVIRDEYSSALGKSDEYDLQESLQKMLVAEEDMDFTKDISSLGKSISANLRELIEEFERSPQDIALQSEEHVHSDDVIMTFGHSRTVERFLKKAASKRKIHVIVAEAFPSCSGRTMAKNLAESNISTSFITDDATSAFMKMVKKVIVGTHSIMANGGLKARIGIHSVALSAKRHNVPFIVLAPTFKLTPQYVTSSDQEGFQHFGPPEEVLPFNDDQLFKDAIVLNPYFDYVKPELVTLLIFNTSGNAPSYVYRLLSELYHPDDHEL